MSADLYLNAVEDTTENRAALAALRDLQFSDDGFIELTSDYARVSDKVFRSVEDRVHVGEVSYGKALLGGDYEKWVPRKVTLVLNLFNGEYLPKVATHALSASVTAAMNAPDRSHYRTWHRRSRGPSRARAIKQFFDRSTGNLVFASVE